MHIKKSKFPISIMDYGSKNKKNLNPKWILKKIDS
jgi:hypothetical protein